MRLNAVYTGMITTLLISGCASKASNPDDPFEHFNRKVYAFNNVVDKVALKPAAKIYKTIVPGPVRKSVNNFYTNVDMIPTVGNDLLQAEIKWAAKDTWRFAINSTIGIGGLFDVAAKFGLPPHANDLGLTLAKWGDKKSPYLVIPLLGPSTLRDGAGWLFQFAIYSPYVYIDNDAIIYGLLGLRYVDLRSQMLDADRLMEQALDKYAFMRDAYIQHRNYLITGEQQDNGSLFVDDEKAEESAAASSAGSDYVDE